MIRSRLAAAGLGTALLAPAALAQNPNSAITNTGQELTVEVLCDDVLDEGDTQFSVGACATLGAPQQLQVNVLFVIDLSGSMNAPDGGPVGDANNDGQSNRRIDAAIEGFVSLGQSLGSNANVELGIIGFANNARIADLTPAPGLQAWISPPDQGDPDFFETVLRSMDSGDTGPEIGLFTPHELGVSTNYEQAFDRVLDIFALQPAGETNLVFFVSDGLPTQGAVGAQLLALVNQAGAQFGIRVNTFGVGDEAPALCQGGILDQIANVTGGTCTSVDDPSQLTTVLPNAGSTRIASLSLSVNGDLIQVVDGPQPSELCIDPVDVLQYLDLFGVNVVEATAVAEDGTQVTATKEVVKTACLLMIGLEQQYRLLDPHDVDAALVVPLMWFNVTEASVPTFEIPSVPELAGLEVYFQVGMHNLAAFPNNPVQMSNGVRVTLGAGALPYGAPTGIFSWFDGSAGLGESFEVRFDVLGM